MLQTMSENLELRYVQAQKSTKPKDTVRIEAGSKERWKRLIYFLLNIEGQVHGFDDNLRYTYQQLL